MALNIHINFVKSVTCALLIVGMLSGTTALSAADLKQKIKVSSSEVRLSDLFTGIDVDNDKVLFGAPLPGQSDQISTSKLWQIAQANNVAWEKPVINKRIRIHREGRPVILAVIKTLIEGEIRAQGVEGNIKVNIQGRNKKLYLPLDSDEVEIEISSIHISSSQDRYRAELLWPTGAGDYVELSLNGLIEHVHLMPVLARMMIPGEVITRDDISWVNFSVKKITSSSIQSAESFIGYTPRRALTANKMLRKSDLEAPKVIKKGDQVLITFISGPLILTTVGKALEHGTTGANIRILNLDSNKTIYAQVISAGQVTINAPRPAHKIASR